MRGFIRILLVTIIAACISQSVRGQAWTDAARGSWVRKGAAQAGDVTLADPRNICEIIVATSENSAVKQAAEFLAADIARIAGQKPPIVEKASGSLVAIHLVTLGAGGNQLPPEVDVALLRDKWEAYQILTDGPNDVWLVGANFRGTAFAAYTLSERLGVDPLYLWTGYQPEKHPTLILSKTSFITGPPTFKYRGMFHDDEDILPRPFEDSGYPLRTGDVPIEWYKKYFETALRLRMNMVAPYTRVHRRYEVQKTASDWGLFYTSHHYDVLLSNPFGIERYGLGDARGLNGPWNWFTNRDGMLRYWQGGVDENKDLNCIWPVGMRGTDDTGYAFPKNMSDAEQAKVFRDVLETQVKMVRASLPPDKTPIFHWTLYTEMLPKYQAHALEVPDGIILVWPDNNDGVMRGLPDKPDKWKHGVYYHLAYLGKEVKQSGHYVHPPRIASEFRKIVDAGATEYMLVNVSELREFVMEARMIAETCWDAKTALAGDDPATRYIQWWCREYFGKDAAPLAAKSYDNYAKCFDSYTKQGIGSEHVHELIDVLSQRFKAGGEKIATKLPSDLRKVLTARQNELKSLLDGMTDAEKSMNPLQAQFFRDHVELPAQFDYRPTCAALKLLDAVEEPNPHASFSKASEAMPDLDALEVAILHAEHPPFDKWYRKTWIRRETRPTNVHRPFEELRAFLASDGQDVLQEPAEWRKPDLNKFKPLLGLPSTRRSD